MIYLYTCKDCQTDTDVIKPISQFERIELCKCGAVMSRKICPPYFHGEKVQDPYYNIGLGQMVKSDKEARAIAKSRGMIEVGNEKPQKHLKTEAKEYMDGSQSIEELANECR